MKDMKIRCPCCDNSLIIIIDDKCVFSSVIFDGKEASEIEAFKQHGICLGMKGGEHIAE